MMTMRSKTRVVHRRIGGWIALVLTFLAMVVAGVLFAPRDPGVRVSYAPVGLREADAVKVADDRVLIDINRADAVLLSALPGIGEARADAIVAYRKQNGAFASIEGLMEVSGIGEKIFEGLKELVYVNTAR